MIIIYHFKNSFTINHYFKSILIIIFLCILSGCQKIVYICNQPVQKVGVIEVPASTTNPAQFYLCGNANYPCSTIRYRSHIYQQNSIISSRNQQKRKAYEKLIVKKGYIIK